MVFIVHTYTNSIISICKDMYTICWRHSIHPLKVQAHLIKGYATISKPLAPPKAAQAAGITNMFWQESASGSV